MQPGACCPNRGTTELSGTPFAQGPGGLASHAQGSKETGPSDSMALLGPGLPGLDSRVGCLSHLCTLAQAGLCPREPQDEGGSVLLCPVCMGHAHQSVLCPEPQETHVLSSGKAPDTLDCERAWVWCTPSRTITCAHVLMHEHTQTTM